MAKPTSKPPQTKARRLKVLSGIILGLVALDKAIWLLRKDAITASIGSPGLAQAFMIFMGSLVVIPGLIVAYRILRGPSVIAELKVGTFFRLVDATVSEEGDIMARTGVYQVSTGLQTLSNGEFVVAAVSFAGDQAREWSLAASTRVTKVKRPS
jgi:hypothetical protein